MRKYRFDEQELYVIIFFLISSTPDSFTNAGIVMFKLELLVISTWSKKKFNFETATICKLAYWFEKVRLRTICEELWELK